MKKKIILIYWLLGISTMLFAQSGSGVYRFLDLPSSARIATLGGTNVSIAENDINFAFHNPALLSADTHGVIGLNAAKYFADITFGTATFGWNFDKSNFTSVGVQYVDYGKFDGRDASNNPLGTFYARDLALYLTYAKPLSEHLTAGITFKPIFSAYEKYSSVGVAFDFGLSYHTKLFGAGLSFRNVGSQIKGYHSDVTGAHLEPLPFDVQLGISQKFKHAPLRLSFTMHHLNHWNLGYNTNIVRQTNLDGTTKKYGISWIDMLFRHTIFGIEFLPTKTFYLSLSYNHRRAREMSVANYKGLSGFSFGGGIKLYKFQLGFSASQFQAHTYTYLFSISTSLSKFGKF